MNVSVLLSLKIKNSYKKIVFLNSDNVILDNEEVHIDKTLINQTDEKYSFFSNQGVLLK